MTAPHFGLGLAGGFDVAAVATLTRRIEAAGYEDVWIPDERFQRDVYPLLTVAAANSESLVLGTCVTDPYLRHPMVTAAAAATVDEVSKGRVRVGLGAGWSGFTALGIDRRRPAVAIREAVTVMRRAWAGEEVTLEGQVIHCEGALLDFPARARLPIYIAGRGPRILEVAGEIGDGVIIGTFAAKRGLTAALGCVERGLARAGRTRADTDVVSWLYVSIADDPEDALLAVRRAVAVALWGSRPILDQIGISIPARLRDVLDRNTYRLDSAAVELAASLIPLELADELAVAGTSDQVRERLSGIFGMGIDGAAVWLHPPAETSYEDALDGLSEVVAQLRRPATVQEGSPERA
jgi:5,10-methylenetetrahydromethanopterin reductase